MPPISVKELRSFLRAQSQEALIEIILELFKRSKEVKDYFSLTLQPGYDQQLTEEFKDKVRKQFFPDRGFGDPSLSTIRKLISDYKRISDSVHGMADLLLYTVELGVSFTNTYGDIDEAFYNSMESTYERALKWIVEHNLQDDYRDRARRVVMETSHIGWGFHDGLDDLYYTYLGE